MGEADRKSLDKWAVCFKTKQDADSVTAEKTGLAPVNMFTLYKSAHPVTSLDVFVILIFIFHRAANSQTGLSVLPECLRM